MTVTNPVKAAKTETEAGLDKRHADLKKATQQFEAYFLHELLKEMRKTVPDDKLLADDGHGQEIFRDMMDQTLSESMSKRGDFGMASLMYNQLAPSLGGEADKSEADQTEPKTEGVSDARHEPSR